MMIAMNPAVTESGEASLIRRAKSGNTAAFDELVRKFRPRILALTMRYLKNPADAEDVVQDTFIKAYRALRHFRGDSAFYTWLNRIAINSVKTAIQLRVHARKAFSPDDWDAVIDHADARTGDLETPEGIASSGELCVAIDAAIDALCDEQRVAIMLREIDGLSYKQMAVAMRCPMGTVRSRVFRAREAIDQRVRRLFDGGLRRRNAEQDTPRDASVARLRVSRPSPSWT
jgi:RNA polymerase sigma-70 factor, ECF subfamily